LPFVEWERWASAALSKIEEVSAKETLRLFEEMGVLPGELEGEQD
jgi:hydrogenase maturation factor